MSALATSANDRTATNVRLPGHKDRLLILGQTGSGKTQAAAWHLSRADFDVRPWVVYDFKGDELLSEIRATEIGVGEIPRKPGLYIVRPLPSQKEEVEFQMWGIWAQENTGVYVDEGYMVENDAWNALLTQGRSKHIPMITLAQRPAWLTRFVFSESGFFQVFYLQDKKDRERVRSFVPGDLETRLPEYHSYYYDVGRDKMVVFRPVPKKEEIIDTFHSRILPKRRWI